MISAGDRVRCTDEYEQTLAENDRGDTGRVQEIGTGKRRGYALVGWDTGVSTWIALEALETT